MKKRMLGLLISVLFAVTLFTGSAMAAGAGDADETVVSVTTGEELKAALEANTASTIRLDQDIEVNIIGVASFGYTRENKKGRFCKPEGKHTLDLNGHDFTVTMNTGISGQNFSLNGQEYYPCTEQYALFEMRGEAELHVIGDGEIRNTFTALGTDNYDYSRERVYGTRLIFDMHGQSSVVIDSGQFYAGRTDKVWVSLAHPGWYTGAYVPYSGYAWAVAYGQIADLRGEASLTINGGHFTGMHGDLIKGRDDSEVNIYDGYFDGRSECGSSSFKNGHILGGTFEFHHFDMILWASVEYSGDLYADKGQRYLISDNEFLAHLPIDPSDPLHDRFYQTRVVYDGKEYTSYKELADVVGNEDLDDYRRNVKLVVEPMDWTEGNMEYKSDSDQEPVSADDSVISYVRGSDLFIRYSDKSLYTDMKADPEMHWMQDVLVTITETKPNGDTSILKHIRPAADAGSFINLHDYELDVEVGARYRWTEGKQKGYPVYFEDGNIYSVLIQNRYRYQGDHAWFYTHTPANRILFAAASQEAPINYSAGLIGTDTAVPGAEVTFEFLDPENYTVQGITTDPEVAVTSVGANKWSFIMPNARVVNVTAQLEPHTYNISVVSVSGGTITPEKTVASYKERVPIQITPDAGRQIEYIEVVSGEGKVQKDEYGNFTVYVLGDTQIKPVFGAAKYYVNYMNENFTVRSRGYYSLGDVVTLSTSTDEWYKGYGYVMTGYTNIPGGRRIYRLGEKVTVTKTLNLFPYYTYNGSSTTKIELSGDVYPKAYMKSSGIDVRPGQMVDIYRISKYRVNSNGSLTACSGEAFDPSYRYVFEIGLMLKEEFQTLDNSMDKQNGNVLINGSDELIDKEYVKFGYLDKYNKFLDYEDPDYNDIMYIRTVPLSVTPSTIKHAKIRVAPIMSGEAVYNYGTKYTTTDDTQYTISESKFDTTDTVFDCSKAYKQTITLTAKSGCLFDGTEFELVGVNDIYTVRTAIINSGRQAQIQITHPAWDTFLHRVTVYGGLALPMYEAGDIVEVHVDVNVLDEFHYWQGKGITIPAEKLRQNPLTFVMPDNDVEITAICGGENYHLRGAVISRVDATCRRNGQLVYQCALEGHTDQITDITPKREHNFIYYAKTGATCISIGYKQDCRYCDRCETFYTAEGTGTPLSGSNVIPVNKNAHMPSVEYDSDDSKHWQICTLCGAVTGEAAHSFTETVRDPETGEVIPDVKACVCGYGHEENPDVVFDTNSLLLSGEIGVNFFVKISEAAQTSDAYMEFQVSGKDNTVMKVPLSKAQKQSDGRFKFTCYITSLQMAETITATYHYGDRIAIGQSSAKAYIDRAKAANFGGNRKLETLLKAIANFGYYTQKALAATHGFTIGTDYKEMDHYSTPNLKVDLSAYAYSQTGTAKGITKVSRSLGLDAETSIYLYFTVDSSHSGAPIVKVKDQDGAAVAVTMAKQSDGRYKLTIPNISAHRLGDAYTITVDGKMTIRMSAISYVKMVLDSSAADADTKNMVASLYEYYKANVDYRAK